MTDEFSELPDDFNEKIDELESELGRKICGFPTEEFEPCQQWPSDESGRCTNHTGLDLNTVLEQRKSSSGLTSPDPGRLNPSSTNFQQQSSRDFTLPEESSSTLIEGLMSSPFYWGLLVVVGLSIGAGTAALTVNFEEVGVGFQSGSQVDLNVQDPNFNRIREFYRNGDFQEVGRRLRTILNETDNSSIKARALYYSFVFYQNRKNYEEALRIADRYLEEYKDHYRRSEILYGAWFICSNLLNRPERAQQYRETLLEEFPESKWAKRLSS